MKPEIKKQWVDALNRGEYQQGRTVLRSLDNKFCCLGVLCDLAVKAGAIPPPVVIPRVTDGGTYLYGEQRMRGVLPTEVSKWAGGVGHTSVLMQMNDGFPKASFSGIAKYIEENL